MRRGNLEVMDDVSAKIMILPGAGGWSCLQREKLEGLAFLVGRRQTDLVEAVPRRGGVGVQCAVMDAPFHLAVQITLTVTPAFTSCFPPPVMIPLTGLTSLK